jgi:hypothetical protein
MISRVMIQPASKNCSSYPANAASMVSTKREATDDRVPRRQTTNDGHHQQHVKRSRKGEKNKGRSNTRASLSSGRRLLGSVLLAVVILCNKCDPSCASPAISKGGSSFVDVHPEPLSKYFTKPGNDSERDSDLIKHFYCEDRSSNKKSCATFVWSLHYGREDSPFVLYAPSFDDFWIPFLC